MACIEAGKLKHKVQVQSASEAADATGQLISTWSTDSIRSAFVRPVNGREFFDAAQVQSDVTHEVTMRHFTGLTTSHRLLFRSRVLNIRSIINMDEHNEMFKIMCKESTGGVE